jgi:F-type H+-transporting ATPase subunit epsilon
MALDLKVSPNIPLLLSIFDFQIMFTYQLSIITPAGKAFEGPTESLIAPGKAGSFGVLANHAPMVAALTQGTLTLKKEGAARHYAISSGILEVGHQKNVLILCDNAREVSSLEEA